MFYVRPPTGEISLHILEKCVMVRLDYLQLLYEGKTDKFNDNFEYLLENSVYDKIGHFTLRLLASASQDLYHYWITREILFFKTRLNHITPRQLYKLLRSILHQLRLLTDKATLINKTLIDLCHFFLKSSIFKHLVSKNNTENCKLYQTKVRYELIPDLIKKRTLDLNKGFAVVYCSKWKDILLSLFVTYTTNELIYMQTHAQYIINRDIRLDYVYQKVHCKIFQTNHAPGRISKNNIDTEMKNFPLCMQHLHTKLRSTHRLSHYARLYYSLFLKDSGMQIEDAMHYWKEEYSKPHSCSTCSHSWQSSENKFIYSIRHLYGLEGSRKNYTSLNCKSMFENVPNSTYEGGCPFKYFDTNTLRNLLSLTLSNDKVTELLRTISSQRPQIACAAYFKTLKQINNDDIVIDSPLLYYLTMIRQF